MVSDTLDEAMQKMQELNHADSALTVSSDENASDVEKAETENIRRSQFLESAASFQSQLPTTSKNPKGIFSILIRL